MKRTVTFWSALLLSRVALAGDATQVENGTVVENGQLDLSGATTLVVPRSAKLARAERPDVQITARKQLGFDGQPPRSMLMTQWRHYLGVMYCRDGERMYLFPYGEWNADPKTRKGRARPDKTGRSRGASVGLNLSVPVPLQIITNRLPPDKGPCSAQYPAPFRDESLPDSYWYTHTAPPPNWTRLELTEGAPGKKKRAGGP